MNPTTESFNWKYCSIGGMTRVEINSGEDIAHLGELDQKKWTVLSCPVKGLNFDAEALRVLDSDSDGQIHINEVISKAEWLTSILKNSDELIFGKPFVKLEDINPETDEGKGMIAAANVIFDIIGKEDKSEITRDDLAAALAIIQQKKETDFPYGDNSDLAVSLVAKFDSKIQDYFVRCSLAAFHMESAGGLDVNADKIAALSDKNLSNCASAIAEFPLVHISAEGLLPLDGKINPAWQADFAQLKSVIFDADFPGATAISKAQWDGIKAKTDKYVADKGVCQSQGSDEISKLNTFLCLNEHFYRFICNFVTFKDFYSRNEKTPAIFQAGKLYIDQRCCDLCIEVSDMAAHNDSAGLSGMYLIYLNCKSVKSGLTKTIVAAMTRGDVDDLRKGKNALFYDREGNEWDATIEKIIENPISIKQAFWSPYKKFWNWMTEKINKSAAEKESKSFSDLTSKAETNIAEADKEKPEGNQSKAKQAFDIAKFAGIFAAIGMAIGYISSALVNLANGIMAKWYNLPLMVLAVIVIISGPSMFLAWCKLRKRNLAPVLNANGWAVNAASIINVAFGATLTSEAKYPGLELVDPLAARQFRDKKKKRNAIIVALVVLALFLILYFTNNLGFIGLPWCNE